MVYHFMYGLFDMYYYNTEFIVYNGHVRTGHDVVVYTVYRSSCILYTISAYTTVN